MPVEPKDSITASHCMKGYTHKDKQGMKNGCLSSNWGAVCSWAGYSSMEKGAWRRTEKQDVDKNGRRETTCVCVSGSNLCFFLWVALKEQAVELMQPNQAHVCAGMWCAGKCAWHLVSQRQNRGRLDQVSSRTNRALLLICSLLPGCPWSLPYTYLQGKLCNCCPDLYCRWR